MILFSVRPLVPVVLASIVALALACGDRGGDDGGPDQESGADTAADDPEPGGDDGSTGDEPDDADTPDAPDDTSADVPLLPDAVPCGTSTPIGGTGKASEPPYLERHDIDLSVFPNARCNDGTGATMYFRPHEGAENANKWVILLQGGGSCAGALSCLDRWCSLDTPFGNQMMSSEPAAEIGVPARGWFARIEENPFAGYNHVFLRYCSSDLFAGTRADVVQYAQHEQIPGGEVEYRIHFLGAYILDAAIATLQRNGVDALVTAIDGVELPDIDEAEQVVFGGGSAGGWAVTFSADHVAATLRAGNVHCAGDECPLDVRVVVDSAFGPDKAELDYSTTISCVEEPFICSYAEVMSYGLEEGWAVIRGDRLDDSCVAWHEANDPGTEWLCLDIQHVIRHHVTTPLFVRMGQRDHQQSGLLIDDLFTVPGQGLITVDLFEELVRADITSLADMQTWAEEGAEMTSAPGVFSPICGHHETLRDNEATWFVEVELDGVTYNGPETFANWVSGDGPPAVIYDGESPALPCENP